jgi:hypothetical protein
MRELIERAAEGEDLQLLKGQVILPRRFVLDNAYLRKDDAAFVGGSLVEGTGNRYSDVDVHVITADLRRDCEIDPGRHYRVLSPDRSILNGLTSDQEVFLIHTVIPGTHIKVDIEYRTWREVEGMASAVRDTFDYAVRSLVLLTKYMSVRDMAFIHRLYHSAPLAGVRPLGELRDSIGRHRFEYLMYRWKASDFSVLLDILGAWEDGDLVRCLDLARENMVTQFQAYSHLCGSTNYHRKWIITYASRSGVAKALLERYLALLTRGCADAVESQRAYVLDTLDFVDDIFDASQERLALRPEYPSGHEACAAIDESMRNEAGDYSEMEIAYRKKAYGVRGTATRNWFTS